MVSIFEGASKGSLYERELLKVIFRKASSDDEHIHVELLMIFYTSQSFQRFYIYGRFFEGHQYIYRRAFKVKISIYKL